METQKILKPNKVCVFADYREKEVIEHLKKLDLIVNDMDLEVGDFVLSDNRVVIERKTHSDFISSIIDGRLFEQAKTMKENFTNPIIIIEGIKFIFLLCFSKIFYSNLHNLDLSIDKIYSKIKGKFTTYSY